MLPQDVKAEAGLLSSIMHGRPQCLPDVMQYIRSPDMFFDPAHRLIYETILSVWEKNQGRGISAVLVESALATAGRMAEVGGESCFQDLTWLTASSASWEYYAKIVAAKALRRSLIVAASEITRVAQDAPDDEVGAIVTQSSELLAEATRHYGITSGPANMMTVLQEAYALIENQAPPKMAAGFWDLDQRIGGCYGGQMIVIAGRPGMGKSALGLNMVLSASKLSKPHALYFSFEMPKADLGIRILSWRSRVPFDRLRRCELSPEQAAAASAALSVGTSLDLEIIDCCSATPAAIRNTVRQVHRQRPLDIVIVDYIQRLHCEGQAATQTRDREMTIISNNMKDMALELGIPVLVLSQLNRACDSREDHRPRPSDLRDSGSLEQDADVIMMLYRDDEYNRAKDGYVCTNIAEVGIVKNRNGPCGTVRLLWDGPTMSFQPLASGDAIAEAAANAQGDE